jgi:hypothetical protein
MLKFKYKLEGEHFLASTRFNETKGRLMKGETTKTTPLPFNCFYPRRPLALHESGNEYGINRFTTVSITGCSEAKRIKTKQYISNTKVAQYVSP